MSRRKCTWGEKNLQAIDFVRQFSEGSFFWSGFSEGSFFWSGFSEGSFFWSGFSGEDAGRVLLFKARVTAGAEPGAVFLVFQRTLVGACFISPGARYGHVDSCLDRCLNQW